MENLYKQFATENNVTIIPIESKIVSKHHDGLLSGVEMCQIRTQFNISINGVSRVFGYSHSAIDSSDAIYSHKINKDRMMGIRASYSHKINKDRMMGGIRASLCYNYQGYTKKDTLNGGVIYFNSQGGKYSKYDNPVGCPDYEDVDIIMALFTDACSVVDCESVEEMIEQFYSMDEISHIEYLAQKEVYSECKKVVSFFDRSLGRSWVENEQLQEIYENW